MDLSILPTKKIINTYKRYSLPVAEDVAPTNIERLQFFYVGTQANNIEKLKEQFGFGYATNAADNAIATVKRLLKKRSAVTVPAMIIAEGSLGTEELVELHRAVYSHKIMADVPFIVEASGLSQKELNQLKKYTFIDELLFLNEFTATALLQKVSFIQKMKQQRLQQPGSLKVETGFRKYPDLRAALKRMLDLVIATALLVALGPLMLLIALIVKLDTGGTVLYGTLRTGRGHQVFNLYKFNTVIQDANKKKNGAPMSKVGWLLRKTYLDELPLLLNVWLGDLSLTGTRALPLYEAALLTTNASASYFMQTPGLWHTQKNSPVAAPVNAPAAGEDKSDLLYDIWLMANKPSAAIHHKSNA